MFTSFSRKCKPTCREEGELAEHLGVTGEHHDQPQVEVDSLAQHPAERGEEAEVDENREEVADTCERAELQEWGCGGEGFKRAELQEWGCGGVKFWEGVVGLHYGRVSRGRSYRKGVVVGRVSRGRSYRKGVVVGLEVFADLNPPSLALISAPISRVM